MSTIDERHERASTGVALNGDTDGWYGDFARPRVFLQPIAAPSVLGLFGFAGATFIVAAHMAGWYGSTATPGYLFPFAFFFGGVAQFTAGMWAYRARDAVATAMHGMWGAFWMDATAAPAGMNSRVSDRHKPPRSSPNRAPSICTASASSTPEIMAPARIRRRGK